MIDRFFKYGISKKKQDTDRLFELFQSLEMVLLLKLAPIIAKKRLPDDEKYDKYDREKQFFYSQPDINSGWDSSRGKYYNGYDLYMLTACDSHNDLPIYSKLNKASMHDSIGLLLILNEFSHRFTICPMTKILLDSAHDPNLFINYLINMM
ncbi:MAG: hypothetical protein U9N10_04310 [Bacillota bacterium]|nr:hypothetical protein [Bacillota bacterium]